VAVRKATRYDLNRIVDLWFEMMNFHIDHNSIYQLKDNAREIYITYADSYIHDSEKAVFIFDNGNTVAGYLFVEIDSLPPVYQESKIGVITEIGVEQSARRNGIGKLLLAQAEEWILGQGVRRAECMVSASNPVSQSFWKKNGYRGYNEICCKDISLGLVSESDFAKA